MFEIHLKDTMPFFRNELAYLFWGDTLQILREIRSGSVDMIFSDPPYFLSNNGITCVSGKAASVNKGDWDKTIPIKAKHEFNRKWIRLCKKILSPNGTIWISGTLHNIYDIGYILEQEGFKIINNITWQKTNPPPNLMCRCFTHSTETIIWARKNNQKSRYFFNYELMKECNNGKQMKDVWTGITTPMREKKHGKHTTQKPLYLLERILLSSTRPGDLVLDPFCGSSTTGVAASRLGRRYIGIDNNLEYIKLSTQRLQQECEK